jgi:hypothetical protein
MATKTMKRNELLPSVTSAEQKEIKGGKKTLFTLEVDKCNNKGQEKNISMTTTIRRRNSSWFHIFVGCTNLTSSAYLWEKKPVGKDLVGHEVKNHNQHPKKHSLVLGLIAPPLGSFEVVEKRF